FLRKTYLVYELLLVGGLDFHENPVGFVPALIQADRKGLTTLGRSLMDNREFGRRMILKEIPQYKLGLGLAVRLQLFIDHHVNCLIQKFGQFLSAARLDGLPDLLDDVVLILARNP